mmetsp:Transcript_30363/g.97752  ORF Transcript_30363/g.97752 Transcript_30363/m.97752 type:complete len:201 (+) Transcript_30363:977-1579(+)
MSSKLTAHGKQQAQAKQSPDILPWMLNASRICFLQYMPMQGNMAQSRLLMSMAVSLSANLSASPSSLPSTYSSSSSCLPPIAHPSIRSPSRPSTTSSSGCYSSVFLRSCQHCCLPTSSTRLRRTEQSRSSLIKVNVRTAAVKYQVRHTGFEVVPAREQPCRPRHAATSHLPLLSPLHHRASGSLVICTVSSGQSVSVTRI